MILYLVAQKIFSFKDNSKYFLTKNIKINSKFMSKFKTYFLHLIAIFFISFSLYLDLVVLGFARDKNNLPLLAGFIIFLSLYSFFLIKKKKIQLWSTENIINKIFYKILRIFILFLIIFPWILFTTILFNLPN
jgi:hypothetical protein